MKVNCKMTSIQVLTLLLLFPQFGIAGASHFKDCQFSCKKDLFYSFLFDECIRWRNLMTCVSRQLVRKTPQFLARKAKPPHALSWMAQIFKYRLKDGTDRHGMVSCGEQEETYN